MFTNTKKLKRAQREITWQDLIDAVAIEDRLQPEPGPQPAQPEPEPEEEPSGIYLGTSPDWLLRRDATVLARIEARLGPAHKYVKFFASVPDLLDKAEDVLSTLKDKDYEFLWKHTKPLHEAHLEAEALRFNSRGKRS